MPGNKSQEKKITPKALGSTGTNFKLTLEPISKVTSTKAQLFRMVKTKKTNVARGY